MEKEHIGYIIDRTGFMEFKKWALEGVTLSEKALMKNNVYWSGIHYTNDFNKKHSIYRVLLFI